MTWDVVEVESPDVVRGCDEGLFEKLDYAQDRSKADFIPAAITDCGMGIFVWSTVMAYNGDKLKTAPTTLGRLLGRQEDSPASGACARAPAITSSSR